MGDVVSNSLWPCLGQGASGAKSLSWQTQGGWVKYPPGLGG
jgi:hypothetical protein